MPSTFTEPIALWLRTNNGTNFLRAQISTGFIFPLACASMEDIRVAKDWHDDAVNHEAKVKEQKFCASRPHGGPESEQSY
ncbi:hypothetical protein BPOR_0404g00070 [Botrytis porri]|uniref:Uncharacterized protein n=1 Tax=Botrytis porri TaxID=87229 RepID=A0A4Z1KS72_9HELO|nr:hypothetical protein BPOR_0404g00070 [Botrytis porri]